MNGGIDLTTEAQRTQRLRSTLVVAVKSTFFWTVLLAVPVGFVLSDTRPPLSATEIVALDVANWICYPVTMLVRPLDAISWYPFPLLLATMLIAQFVWAVLVANLFALVLNQKKSL